jgi:Fic family protein
VYIHGLSAWPDFRWDHEALSTNLAEVRHRQGRLIGRMEGLGFRLREEAVLDTLTQDVLKSSEIEGEVLDRDQVRSSIARRLGLDIGALTPADRDVEGVVEMMLDSTQHYTEPLTEERLFGWHASLFPTRRSAMHRIKTGAWRDDRTGPMQVVSGPVSKERVQFEAPAAKRLARELKAFLKWFNRAPETDPVLKAALSHLWFVTIHPFDDDNGRIARTIADMGLARSEASPKRFYSMSAQIRLERNDYHDMLERTQKEQSLTNRFDRGNTTAAHVLSRLFQQVPERWVVLDQVLEKTRIGPVHAAARGSRPASGRSPCFRIGLGGTRYQKRYRRPAQDRGK